MTTIMEADQIKFKAVTIKGNELNFFTWMELLKDFYGKWKDVISVYEKKGDEWQIISYPGE